MINISKLFLLIWIFESYLNFIYLKDRTETPLIGLFIFHRFVWGIPSGGPARIEGTWSLPRASQHRQFASLRGVSWDRRSAISTPRRGLGSFACHLPDLWSPSTELLCHALPAVVCAWQMWQRTDRAPGMLHWSCSFRREPGAEATRARASWVSPGEWSRRSTGWTARRARGRDPTRELGAREASDRAFHEAWRRRFL